MTTTSPSPEPASERVMRQLWQRMAEIYGHKWVSAYGEDAGKGAGLTWAKGLSGLGPQKIARGLEAALVSAEPWPPTLPEFRALCLGIPSLAAVRTEFRGGAAATPFGRLVWGHLDPYLVKRVDAEKADRMVRDAYETAREWVMRGGELPAEPVAVIAAEKPQPPKPASPAVVSKVFAELNEAFGE